MSDNIPVPDLATSVGPGHHTEISTAQVVAPATTAELSEVLRAANADGLTVVPTGGGTKLGWGNPVKADVLLSTARLSGVREHAWADLTATVGAGTPWADLQAVLARNGQRVALDPVFPARATVGGVLATNDSGLLRERFGSLRDLVLGMTIVLADGTVARTGGKVVKNVAGYDLPKLLTGSFGTLGVITEATFRLHPEPTHRVQFTVRSPELPPLAELLKRIPEAYLVPEAAQLRKDSSSYVLDLQFASDPKVLSTYEGKVRELAPALAVEPAHEAVWLEREALFADPDSTVLKITCLPSRAPAIVAGFAQLAQAPSTAARAVAELSGIVFASLQASPFALATIVEDLRTRLAAHGGMVVVLQRGALPRDTDPWGGSPAAINVMRAVKVEFDPQRTLSPGRFVGGL